MCDTLTVLTQEGDGIAGKRIVYIARKITEPRLIAKSRRHRGLQGVLHDADAYIDVAVEM